MLFWFTFLYKCEWRLPKLFFPLFRYLLIHFLYKLNFVFSDFFTCFWFPLPPLLSFVNVSLYNWFLCNSFTLKPASQLCKDNLTTSGLYKLLLIVKVFFVKLGYWRLVQLQNHTLSHFYSQTRWSHWIVTPQCLHTVFWRTKKYILIRDPHILKLIFLPWQLYFHETSRCLLGGLCPYTAQRVQ